MAKRDKEKKPKKAKADVKLVKPRRDPQFKAKPLPAPKELTLADRSRNLRIAKSRAADKPATAGPRFPLKPPDLMPGVVPAGSTPAVAMDYCPGVYEFAGQAYAFDPNFQGFPGYPYLANLATRAEYRAFASTMASELFREWIKIKSKSADEAEKAVDDGRIAELEKAIEEYDLRGVFQRVAAQDCFFGRGQISINIKGANDELPLVLSPKTVKVGSLTSFTTVEAIWTSPSAYNAIDPTAPDFYKPREWFMLGKRVHASRLLSIVTRPLPDIMKAAFNFSGMSLSQLAEPYVNNWLRTRQSVSDLINNFSITALKTDMGQMLQGDCDGSDVLNRADFFTLTRSNRGLMLLDNANEDLVQLNTPLSGLHELQAQSQEHMCSVSRIPAMILTGISPSGLNASSEGEIRAFYDWISSQQQSFYKHPLDICIKLLMLNLWGEIDETITFEFNPLWQTSALEESQIRLNNANADTAYLDRGVVSQEEVRDKLSKDPESGYAGIDPGEVPEPVEGELDEFGNPISASGEPDSAEESDSTDKSTQPPIRSRSTQHKAAE
jgi:phage-related protein (TIGR01555 family)